MTVSVAAQTMLRRGTRTAARAPAGAPGPRAVLLANRREFQALPDPAVGRWRAIRVFLQLATSGVLINFVVLWVGHAKLAGSPSAGERLVHSVLSLVGVSGPVRFRVELLDDL